MLSPEINARRMPRYPITAAKRREIVVAIAAVATAPDIGLDPLLCQAISNLETRDNKLVSGPNPDGSYDWGPFQVQDATLALMSGKWPSVDPRLLAEDVWVGVRCGLLNLRWRLVEALRDEAGLKVESVAAGCVWANLAPETQRAVTRRWLAYYNEGPGVRQYPDGTFENQAYIDAIMREWSRLRQVDINTE